MQFYDGRVDRNLERCFIQRAKFGRLSNIADVYNGYVEYVIFVALGDSFFNGLLIKHGRVLRHFVKRWKSCGKMMSSWLLKQVESLYMCIIRQLDDLV